MATSEIQGYPLTREQRRLWFFQSTCPPMEAIVRVVVRKVVDLDELSAFVARAAQRLEATRMRLEYLPGAGAPLQRVCTDNTFRVTTEQTQPEPPTAISLPWSPCLEIGITKLSGTETELAFRVPSIALDRRSLVALALEVLQETNAYAESQAQAIDLAMSQQEQPWAERYRGVPRNVWEREHSGAFVEGRVEACIEARLAKALRALVTREKCSLTSIVEAAWRALHVRLEGAIEQVVGILDETREREYESEEDPKIRTSG